MPKILKVQENKYVRVATIDQPTARVVVAFLVEERNGETFFSEPKILQIIPKEAVQPTLPGVQVSYALPCALKTPFIPQAVLSPFIQNFFWIQEFAIQQIARPPTL